MMPTVRTLLLALPLVASCATSKPVSPNAAPQVAGATGSDRRGAVRIVDPAYGREHSARAEPMTVPFGPDTRGTELVVGALEQARARGAAYVGELAIVMTFRSSSPSGQAAIECKTEVRFERDPAAAKDQAAAPAIPSSVPTYGTEIERYKPQRVGYVAEDRDLTCAGDDEGCSWTPVTRNGERYDYEAKLGFVPPNWEQIAARFAAGRLVPAEPACYAISEAELRKASPYRLTAVVYHRAGEEGGPAARDLPRRGKGGEERPGRQRGETEAECTRRLRAMGVASRPDPERGRMDESAAQCRDQYEAGEDQ